MSDGSAVVLIEVGISKYVMNIEKRTMNIGKPSYVCMMSILMLHLNGSKGKAVV